MRASPIALQPSLVTCQYPVEARRFYSLEFFRGTTTIFYFTDINDPSLQMMLDWVSEGIGEKHMVLDLEWKAFPGYYDDQKASLFQIGTSKRVVIIRYAQQESMGTQHEVLQNFLLSHKFVGKGIGNDLIKLRERFNINFSGNVDDFERMHMRKYASNKSFNSLIEAYAGAPTAMYKDKSVTFSNWNAPTLSYQQVLYSVYDVVSLYQAYIGAQVIRTQVMGSASQLHHTEYLNVQTADKSSFMM